ncbi:GspE/PulE family protein [Thiohalobacter thiocyanaticus]|nr:ATPase, T2SS/T4P/T4SS family [Thiohalobacter thiocyanaticus]
MSLHEIERMGKEKPVVRMVNHILTDAIHRNASDIHIRPDEDDVALLFRQDGSLVPIRRFNKALLAAVVARIKIIGRMNIAERRLPQDGRARMLEGDSIVDMRISVIPTVNGESVVIRLLNVQTGLRSISDIGFNSQDAERFVDLLHKSYGMLLVTGPTGSGKSTTLYAALQEVRKQNVNIITVEDPVEYHIDGIEQIQVNTAPGFTFARALRNILRHDPDVIMVGEIRDQETARIAVESALPATWCSPPCTPTTRRPRSCA